MFAFFGVVAVAGTAYVQMKAFSWLGLAASVPAGLLACALLMVNNLRDIRTDTVAGKRTLAVMLGDARSRVAYVLTLLRAVRRRGAARLLPAAHPDHRAGAAAGPAAGPGGPGGRVGSRPDQGARPDRAAAAGVRHRAHDRPGYPSLTIVDVTRGIRGVTTPDGVGWPTPTLRDQPGKHRLGWYVSGRIVWAGTVGVAEATDCPSVDLGLGARWVDYSAQKGPGCVIPARLRAW